MCKWGDDTIVKINEKNIKVDSCLAPLIQMLNEYGVKTIACCCGHGKSKYSHILIDSKNIEFPIVDEDAPINLKFLYQGGK